MRTGIDIPSGGVGRIFAVLVAVLCLYVLLCLGMAIEGGQ